MPERFTISLPDGCTLLTEAQKGFVGGTGTSTIVREALKALIEKNKSGDISVPLPTWSQFDKSLSTMDDEALKQAEVRLKQLLYWTNRRQVDRKKVSKIK
jgi:hypothetical protein